MLIVVTGVVVEALVLGGGRIGRSRVVCRGVASVNQKGMLDSLVAQAVSGLIGDELAEQVDRGAVHLWEVSAEVRRPPAREVGLVVGDAVTPLQISSVGVPNSWKILKSWSISESPGKSMARGDLRQMHPVDHRSTDAECSGCPAAARGAVPKRHDLLRVRPRLRARAVGGGEG